MARCFKCHKTDSDIPENDIVVILAAVAAVKNRKRTNISMSAPPDVEIAVIEAAIKAYRASEPCRISIKPPCISMWKMMARLHI